MKKTLIGVLLITSLTAGSGAVYALNGGTFAGLPTVNLRLNGSYIDITGMETPPVIINDRTYVPLRFVSESLGAYVNWDENTRTVIINSSGSSTPPDTPGAYSNLPLTQTVNGFTITVKSVVNNPKTNLSSANTTVS
ncbi:MAG: copper amine oxidase N-terminal domain-containing protein, partial [Syntrophomonadaceae bacterium]|nr:copper amine oxidase N-terminal domain-containing protein [Syntrophomonadaceae bacterium]